jgi:serine/threonine-protein kinase
MLDWGRDPRAPEQMPEVLGRYEILLPIASGGVAAVYLASSTGAAGFERDVAIKLTHRHLRDSPEFFTQLVDEARLAGKIHHPNVVSVHDVGLADKSVFIVMDYIEGESLAAIQQLLKHRDARLPLPVALRILDDVLAGLHAAHELRGDDGALQNLVHRDVTPHNILVGMDGITRLTDFGVAKARARLTKTSPGFVKGKIAYMSPEQAQGQRLDRTVDVWAAGVVAWELLSGTRLHEGTNDPVVMLKIAREPPMRLRHVRPDLPRELDAVLAEALAMDPRARPQTAEALAAALTRAADRAGILRADAREVRAFMQGLLGPELEARREKIAGIRALKKRWTDLEEHSQKELREAPPSPPEAPSLPLSDRLEPTMDIGPRRAESSSPSRAPSRRFSAMSAGLETLLTAPLHSRAWVVVSLLPALALALAWVLLQRTTPDATRAVPLSPTSAAVAPPAASQPPPPGERVLTPADLAEAPADSGNAPWSPDGVITPSELGVEPLGEPDAGPRRRR